MYHQKSAFCHGNLIGLLKSVRFTEARCTFSFALPYISGKPFSPHNRPSMQRRQRIQFACHAMSLVNKTHVPSRTLHNLDANLLHALHLLHGLHALHLLHALRLLHGLHDVARVGSVTNGNPEKVDYLCVCWFTALVLIYYHSTHTTGPICPTHAQELELRWCLCVCVRTTRNWKLLR